MPPSSSLDPVAPSPTLSADSDYRVNPLAHQVFSVAQTDLQSFSMQNGLNAQAGVSPSSAASDGETPKPALLTGQPLVYVPSTSLFMLYGNVQEGPSPGSGLGSERDGGSLEVTASEQSPTPSVQKRLGEERKPQEEEPATKRQSRDYDDSPLALVMPKVREFGEGGTCLVTSC